MLNKNTRSARVVSPADSSGKTVPVAATMNRSQNPSRRLLMVDLNNFASFPTLAIGLLVAALRNAGQEVRVICPLAYDVPAAERERRENYLDHIKRRIHLSTWAPFNNVRNTARQIRYWWNERPHRTVVREVSRALDDRPDVLLLSAYLQHFNSVRAIAAIAKEKGIPVILGGPMFNIVSTAKVWSELPGITAVVGAEVDRSIAPLIDAVCEKKDLAEFPGITLPDGSRTAAAAPLMNLDDTPMADFTDFPWDRYPVRIVPLMTGRGCQWNRCVFCSDIVSVSGRSYRTRSVENVLLEMQEQSRRHNTTNFLFLDLKLNSYPDMIRGIASEIHRYVHGAEWIGTVHVDQRKDNGLSRRDLKAAAAGGMRRISFGLESGSQRLLDMMDKGCSVEVNSEFLRNAHEAGLSVRCTMFKGFPGETAEDMELTAKFLADHAPYLDRVRFNEFSLLEDTPIYNAMVARAKDDGEFDRFRDYPKLDVFQIMHKKARAEYVNHETANPAYRKAKSRALRIVHEINRRPIRSAARQFDGLM